MNQPKTPKAAYFDTGSEGFALQLNGKRVGKIDYGKMRDGKCDGYEAARAVCKEITRALNSHQDLLEAAQIAINWMSLAGHSEKASGIYKNLTDAVAKAEAANG